MSVSWVACALFLFATTSATVGDIPRDRPTSPLATSTQPLYSRRVPSNSSKEVPPQRVQPSPSSLPRARPVDERIITVGNEMLHRHFMDFNEYLQVVLPGLAFGTDGNVTLWEVYTGRDCQITAQVFRLVPPPVEVQRNPVHVHAFELVGSNHLNVEELGHNIFKIPPKDQIHVRKGDIIGFYTSGAGCVSFSDGGDKNVQFRYGAPSHREVKSFQGVLTVGPGITRTYSISCTGSFVPSLNVTKPRVSPTPSPSHFSRPTPSRTPMSATPSLTPIRSKSSSQSASPSPSRTASVSESPSVTPSPSMDEAVCTRGLEVVCSTPSSMRLCNLVAETCIISLQALNLPIPDHLDTTAFELIVPSPTSSPTPSPIPSPFPVRNATHHSVARNATLNTARNSTHENRK